MKKENSAPHVASSTKQKIIGNPLREIVVTHYRGFVCFVIRFEISAE